MAIDKYEPSRRKHRRNSHDESEEPSKRHKHRHHRRRRHHKIRNQGDEVEAKNDGEGEAKPNTPPPATIDVVANGNWRPDYDMEEGEILEEDEASKNPETSDRESGEIRAAVAIIDNNTVCFVSPYFIISIKLFRFMMLDLVAMNFLCFDSNWKFSMIFMNI